MVNENLVIMAGHVTRDPEPTALNNGGQVVKFGMAANRRWNNRTTGQLEEEVTFTEWEAYEPWAATILQYVKKGMPLYCRGRIRFNQWVDTASGENRNRITFVVERFEFGGTREQNGLSPGTAPTSQQAAGQPPANQMPPAAPGQAAAPAGMPAPVEGDDIPF